MTKTVLPKPELRSRGKKCEVFGGGGNEYEGTLNLISETHPIMASAEQLSTMSTQLKSEQIQNEFEKRTTQFYYKVPRLHYLKRIAYERTTSPKENSLSPMEKWQAQSMIDEPWNGVGRVHGDYMTKCNVYVTDGTDWSCEVANGEECGAPC
jgi:hypothetical protein